jgi:ribosomal protein S18 acetylase RimI-like enzyme
VAGFDIVIRDTADDAEISALRQRIHEFNFETTGYRDGRSLSCFLYDGGELIAGIDGFTWGGYARIDYLWVDAARRGAGLGSRLLSAAEDEARARACVTIVLDTHSFQAPGLYRKHGYTEIGTTMDTPLGHSQTIFQKRL